MDRIPRVISAQTQPPHILIVTFDDGQVRDVDMKNELWGKMFEPLKDPEYFARVGVNEELGTVVWPNGLDLDPETLYDPALRPSLEVEAPEVE